MELLRRKSSAISFNHEDSETLFTKYNVTDLRTLEYKLKNDQELKKQELRLMVGERYRDLIDAADSIKSMSESGRNLHAKFSQLEMISDVSLLKNQQLESRQDKSKQELEAQKKKRLYSVAAQIKLLVDNPEQIWHALENHSYLRASKLYLISRMVYKNLQSTSADMKLDVSFPVVQSQWDAVSHFRSQIVKKAVLHLKELNQTDQSLTETLLSIMLLDGISVKSILEKFLSIRRSQILDDILKNVDFAAYTLSEHLTNSIHALISTLEQVARIFVNKPEFYTQNNENKDCLIEFFINSLSKKKSNDLEKDNAISNLYSEKVNAHIIFKHLPANIKHFSPYFISSEENESISITKNWLEGLLVEMESRVSDILQYSESGKGLNSIRQEVLKVLVDLDKEIVENIQETRNIVDRRRSSIYLVQSDIDKIKFDVKLSWKETKSIFNLESETFSIWNSIFRNPMNSRVKQIIESSFDLLSEQPMELISPRLLNLESMDQNFGSFLWTSSMDDTFDDTFADMKITPCKIQTNSQFDISNAFEKGYSDIQNDAMFFLQCTTVKEEGFENEGGNDLFNLKSDATAFLQEFQNLSIASITKYKDSLLQVLSEIPDTNIDMHIYVGRVARSLAIKMKQMENIFFMKDLDDTTKRKPGALSSYRSLDKGLDSPLIKLQQTLMVVYHKTHSLWIHQLLATHFQIFKQCLNNQGWLNTYKLTQLWENSVIDDEKVLLPVSSSDFIMDFCYGVCEGVNSVAGFGLEVETLIDLMVEFSRLIHKEYSSFLSADTVDAAISEKGAMQVFFDLLYLKKIFQGCFDNVLDNEESEYKNVVKETEDGFVNLIGIIKRRIDPVDLSLAESYIFTNIDMFYYRTSIFIGGILTLNAKPVEIKKNLSSSEQLNITGSGQIPRFTLLPVPELEGFSKRMYKKRTDMTTKQHFKKSKSKTEPRPKPTMKISLVSKPQATSSKASGMINTVFGLTSGTSTSISQGQAAAQQRATELFSSASTVASTFFSGVWGSGQGSSSNSPRTTRRSGRE